MQAFATAAQTQSPMAAHPAPALTETLGRVAHSLGQFEAYEALSRKMAPIEELLDTDDTTRRVLVHLHDEITDALNDAEPVAEAAHTRGFAQILRLAADGLSPSLASLREEAREVIAEGWTMEDMILEAKWGMEIEDPFAPEPVEEIERNVFEIDF